MSELRSLLREYWERVLHDHPTLATQLGDRRFEDRLTDCSEEARAERLDFEKHCLRRARDVEPETLSEGDRVEREIFIELIDTGLRSEELETHLIPMTQLFGPHLDLLQLTAIHPTEDRAGLESYVERLRSFPKQVDQIIELMRLGLEKGMVGAKVNFSAILEQVRAQSSPESSPLLRPFEGRDDRIDGMTTLASAAEGALREAVAPAYAKLAEFIERAYLPRCREVVGVHALPRGEEIYRRLTARCTTTELSPEEIHRIGLDEVARIQGEMESVIDRVGFTGGLKAFTEHLRGRPELHCESADAVLEGFRSVLDAVREKLPLLFGHLPQAGFEVWPIEDYRAANAPDAYYMPPAGERPGVFYANTYEPRSRPRYTMEALAYHEAVPGHHLQIAVAQEIEGLPEFRKYGVFTAYVEGWALYSERLPREVGFYQDLYSEFGRLTMEIWRAARLVVDTGLHHKGWTHEQAVEYLVGETALSRHNVVAEVDRYICMPGQALAYKIGELRISEIRRRAEAAAIDFDLRGFHDRLLALGGAPLDVLETWMNQWIERDSGGH